MAIRVGVDVGGTFTKAVAFDLAQGEVVAEAVVPTTHDHTDGVAAGVVDVVTRIAEAVGADQVEMVTHSTTQAVNALLEGDVAKVGLVGLGRVPDLRKARRRTVDTKIETSEGRPLARVSEFLDVTNGLDPEVARDIVRQLRSQGAEAIAVAEAFAPDDDRNEHIIADAAVAEGLPVTTSADLTGLYGLELRAVTAALNASILPIALRTSEVVGAGVAAAGIQSPVMVMRGDGGATDLGGFERAPARTLYSGPAASVAGALRSGRVEDAVIVEVGGTSTNVAAIRRGRPALSYVTVASHSTALRAIDVRVIGVAGGSMLRARRGKVYGVGPRSAHIAGLPYTCFLDAADIEGATTEYLAPRPGDPDDYLVLRLADGRRAALTNTCAANARDLVEDGDYAQGSADAARAGFAIAGAALGLPGDEVARRVLAASTQAIGDLVAQTIRSQRLKAPTIVAVGGGAGGLGRAVATAMGLELVVPPRAEVISAIGDALSLVRAERERTYETITPRAIQELVAEVEAEAISAGAAASTLDIRVEQVPDRGAVRVTVTGAVGLSSGAVPGREPADAAQIAAVAQAHKYSEPREFGHYWLATEEGRVAVFDRYGDLVIDTHGEVLATVDAASVAAAVERQTKRVGPVSIAPDAWVVSGPRFLQVPETEPETVVTTAAACAVDGSPPVVVVGRE